MTIAVFVLHAVQMGLRLEDLDCMEYGTVIDMMIESQNDELNYNTVASQDDFDRF